MTKGLPAAAFEDFRTSLSDPHAWHEGNSTSAIGTMLLSRSCTAPKRIVEPELLVLVLCLVFQL